MHELALAQSVLEIVKERAKRELCSKVIAVRLEIGELSHVESQALLFCFDAVALGSIAEGARLKILRTPGQARCKNCSQDVHIASYGTPCPICGGYDLKVINGEQARVKDIEVEQHV